MSDRCTIVIDCDTMTATMQSDTLTSSLGSRGTCHADAKSYIIAQILTKTTRYLMHTNIAELKRIHLKALQDEAAEFN